MKLNRSKLRKLILQEMSKFGRGDLPKRPPQPSFRYDGPEDLPYGNFLGRSSETGGIDIVYDGFENYYDQTTFDFIINGQEVSTRPNISVDMNVVSEGLGELIAQVTGADYANPEEEARIDKIALDFLMNNKQFQQDLEPAFKMMLDYDPGY